MASPLVLQPDATAGKDTYLSAGAATNRNYGASLTNQAGVQTALIAFDLSSLSSVTVTAASLSLYCLDSGTVDATLACYKMLVAWIEGTKINATATAGEPCWNYREYNTVAWGAAGARGSGTDHAVDASDTVAVPAQTAGWYALEGPGMAADVQDIIDGGDNNGWCLFTGEAAFSFFSSDYIDDTSLRPKFTVTYTEGGGGGGIAHRIIGSGIVNSRAIVRGAA